MSEMGSLLQCLFHVCCDDDDDDDDNVDGHDDVHPLDNDASPSRRMAGLSRREYSLQAPSSTTIISRGGGARIYPYGSDMNTYQVAPQSSHEDEEGNDNDREAAAPAADPAEPTSGGRGSCRNEPPYVTGIRDFLRSLTRQWRGHDSSLVPHLGEERRIDDSGNSERVSRRRSSSCISSPLRTASSFDSSMDIPTICAEEVVLPGSDLQNEMAKVAALKLESQHDECVICMDVFDETNPRMPTLCGCGENKTYFHLPCLYQWIEQNENCPSCWQKLTWEEF